MLIRISLWLVGVAFFFFVILTGLHFFGWPVGPEVLLQFAIHAWLLGFILLFIGAIVMTVRLIFQEFINCFSASARLQRRLWYAQAKQAQLTCLFLCKRQYMDYVHERQRQQILSVNNSQDILHVARLIRQELSRQKYTLPHAIFIQLQQRLKNSIRRQDLNSLLQLQQYLSNHNLNTVL